MIRFSHVFLIAAFIALIGFSHPALAMYDADNGRFLSRDPIGYEGGVNLYGYVGDRPLGATDPSGTLRVTQYGGWTKYGNNEYRVRWAFDLTKDASSAGAFVQEIRIFRLELPCKDGCCDILNHYADVLGASAVPKQRFWESFGLNPTINKRTTVTQNALRYTDTWGFSTPRDSCGIESVVGIVSYFSAGQTGVIDDDTWPDKAAASRLAPSTKTQPGFWSQSPVEGPVTRTVTFGWDQCSKSKAPPRIIVRF